MGRINIERNQSIKPFLRWAGGKTWLIKHLDQFLPKKGYRSYHEPFLGGGSIFFHLKPPTAYLSDLNKELIDTYEQIKTNVEDVIIELAKFENNEEHYYSVRGEDNYVDAKRAAKFIYLNQTSFNGIYRVNLKGVYNVPYGYRNINFFSAEHLRGVSKALSNVELYHADFRSTVDNVKENDLVFLDPPYTVTHNHNGFIKYNKKLFDLDSQIALAKYIDEINDKGAFYILTNAAHEQVEMIFKKEDNRLEELKRASLIGGRNAKRGRYAELIITNVLS